MGGKRQDREGKNFILKGMALSHPGITSEPLRNPGMKSDVFHHFAWDCGSVVTYSVARSQGRSFHLELNYHRMVGEHQLDRSCAARFADGRDTSRNVVYFDWISSA
jgi:hypothetical protein